MNNIVTFGCSYRFAAYEHKVQMPWMQYTPRTLDEIIKRWEQHHVEAG